MKNKLHNHEYIISGAVTSKVRMVIMSVVAVCLIPSVLTGCIGTVKPAAQTRQEAFTYYENESSMFTEKQSYTSTLRYEAVIEKVQNLSEKCLNFNTKVVNRGTGPSRSPTGIWTYRTYVEPVSHNRAELTVRRTQPAGLTPANHMPEGGYFYILVNYTKNKQGLADFIAYGPSMGDGEIMGSLKAWTQGSNSECPVEFDD